MVVRTTTIKVRVLEHNEDWKPEIEHIKGSDLLKMKETMQLIGLINMEIHIT